MNVLKELKQLSEADYKAFNKRIINTNQKVLGVRVPTLRKLAKQIVKDDPCKFIEQDKKDVFEMVMLEGMVLSYMNESFVELLPKTEKFLRKVDSWAQIDSSVCDFKNIKNEKKDVLKVVKKWLKSKDEFVVRAGLVILLAHFVEQKYLSEIFRLSQSVKHDGYYVKMANAWLISVCMAKFPDETFLFFKNNKLDDWTHNKAIQKSRESYRVNKEYKEILKGMKR